MTLEEILGALELAGTEKTKRNYQSHGAVEPVFGVTIKDLKPMAKLIGTDQPLARALYKTGNYDAMYLAGMIADTTVMTEAEFEEWMDQAYFYMISDYTVAIMLTEAEFAMSLADKWIKSGHELRASAGWSTYTWLLGSRPDAYFDYDALLEHLKDVQSRIHGASNRERYSMNNFVMAVALSYKSLHETAVEVAKTIGSITVDMGGTSCKVPEASVYIEKNIKQGRIGFKRKHVRC
jgi:3-methyladenine DNA glycosylase AlkD